MSITVQEFLENKKLPPFLVKGLKPFTKIDKVFSRIGIPNFEVPCELHNLDIAYSSAIHLIEVFRIILEEPSRILPRYNDYYVEQNSDEKQSKISYWGDVCQKLHKSFGIERKEFEKFVVVNNEKISLKLYEDIIDNKNKTIFKAGESLFKIYNKIYSELQKLGAHVKIEKLDSMPEFKKFSSDNLPQTNLKIVFSSEGINGAWDIATMSMRGIYSCQSWNGQYKGALVGSIVDPFVGIIYLTSNAKFNNFGPKMIRRSVVRFVINSESKKPYLIIDKIYPNYDKEVEDNFINALKQKIGDRMDVISSHEIDHNLVKHSYIPINNVYRDNGSMTRSYRDLKIPFRDQFEQEPTIREKNISTKNNKFIKLLTANSFSSEAIYTLKNSNFEHISRSENVIKFLQAVVNSTDFKYLMKEYYRSVALEIIQSAPKETSSKDYMKRICYDFIFKDTKRAKIKFVKKINEYYKKIKPNNNTTVNCAIITKLLLPVDKYISSFIKQELKNIIFASTSES